MTTPETLAQACEQFLIHRQAANRSPHTLSRYGSALRQWQRWRAGGDLAPVLPVIDVEEFRRYFHYLAFERRPHDGSDVRPAEGRAGLRPGAVAAERSAIRAFWNFCAGEGWLTEEQRRIFVRGRVPPPAPEVDEEDRAYWDEDLVQALLAACDGPRPEQNARDRAIVRLFFASGLRLDELCRLDEEHCRHGQRQARIVGKGRKKRWVFWDQPAAEAIAAYQAVRRGTAESGPLFRGVNRQNNGGRLTRDAVRARIKRLFKRAGRKPPAQAPVHSGRHGYAHAMLDGGAELTELQQLMGHASPVTTARYLRERPEKLRHIYQKARARWSGTET